VGASPLPAASGSPQNEQTQMIEQTHWTIEGGARLAGTIEVRGGKNSAPKQIVASLLTDQPCTLSNVPKIGDVHWALDVCQALGSEVTWLSDHSVRLRTPRLVTAELASTYGGSSRLPILLLGPLLARTGQARIPHGGGCQIGSRPVEFHIDGLRRLGAEVVMNDGWVEAQAGGIRGGIFEIPYPSVGATETLLLAAASADGTTVLRGIALEPEVLDLIALLHKMGAQIRFESDRGLIIRGVEKLSGYQHRCMTDRNECASWACAAVATDGDVRIKGADQPALLSLLDCLREIGGEYEVFDDGVRLFRSRKALSAVRVHTSFHPGFMSDWQPPLTALLTQAHGQSVVHETVYEDRFCYVQSLVEMGANITLHTECLGSDLCRHAGGEHPHSCVITGPTRLRAADLTMPDLRGGFAHVVAALLAEGTSRLCAVEQIDRGYADFLGKATALGAKIAVHEPVSETTPSDAGRIGVA
jgi:UDP-N-acetylglucosamine 1-carboxyvinyltransferase